MAAVRSEAHSLGGQGPLRELPVTFVAEPGIALAGTVCVPEDASAARRVPAVVLLGGTGGDTRDARAIRDDDRELHARLKKAKQSQRVWSVSLRNAAATLSEHS